MAVRGKGDARMSQKVKGIKRYNFPVINQVSHEDIMYGIWTRVNIVITLYSDKWLLDLSW